MSATQVAGWRREEHAGLRKEVMTPEGVPLVFTLATAGERAAAFVIDLVILAAVMAVAMVLTLIATTASGGWAVAFGAILFFVLRNFYFTLFELRWKGATPGKRAVGLRVMDARGGMLASEAIVVRNLSREVELFLPLTVLLAPEVLGVGRGWPFLVASVWVLVAAALPFFNRERLRLGDLLGGTIVVVAPRPRLLEDLAAAGEPAGELTFEPKQLELYGVYELQVLEDLLRQQHVDPRDLRTVAARIQKKIAWRSPGHVDDRAFLEAFYRAQRSRLEKDLLLGRAREKKREGRLS